MCSLIMIQILWKVLRLAHALAVEVSNHLIWLNDVIARIFWIISQHYFLTLLIRNIRVLRSFYLFLHGIRFRLVCFKNYTFLGKLLTRRLTIPWSFKHAFDHLLLKCPGSSDLKVLCDWIRLIAIRISKGSRIYDIHCLMRKLFFLLFAREK